MITKHKVVNYYTGPRALFDPNLILPQLLYRTKHQKDLYKWLKDSLYDNFPLNILYQGIQGIGKRTLVNKVLDDLFQENKENHPFQKIVVDCKEKSLEELMYTLFTEFNKITPLDIDLNSVLYYKTTQLWNLFKLSIKKINTKIFLILANIENINIKVLKKFLYLGKQMNITVISTINKMLNSHNDFPEFDIIEQLTYFSFNELCSILEQRANLAFSNKIDKEVLEFLTDLIFEFHVPVPGKGIEILKGLYPYLKKQSSIKMSKILDISKNHLDFNGDIDEFSLLSYISEEEILTIIFLNNLSTHYIGKTNYYITLNKLKELYDKTCDSLRYNKDKSEFKKIIISLIENRILKTSYKKLQNEMPSKYTFNREHFYMTLEPNQLNRIIDAIFGSIL